MKRAILLILVLISMVVKSQITTYNLPPKVYYSQAKITLTDFTKYECNELLIKSDSVFFVNSNYNSNGSLALSKIDYIRVKTGNQGLKWCGYGALFMGLVAVSNLGGYPNYQYDSGGFVIGFTLSGALIGGLVGLAIPKWKSYYLNH